MNVYEDALPRSRMELERVKTEDECMKTEDVYQTLHQPPSVKNPNPTHEPVRSCGIEMVLMVFNTLLLIIILILIGIFSEDSGREELWRLHRAVFYLFWEAEGSCTEALNFCRDRNSDMGTVTHENKEWILSQANGRKLWVYMDGVTTGPLNKTLRQCPLDGGNSAEDAQGWVCEGGQGKHLQVPRFLRETPLLLDFYDGINSGDYEEFEQYTLAAALPEEPTAGPERERPASSAASPPTVGS
ncbi:hypothetical protein AOLI_G00263330 [Acnodon oligacanthus]